MKVEPWQVMIGLSIVLVLVGSFAYLGITSPLEAIFYLILIAGVFVAMYFGYRLGTVLADNKG